MNPSRAAGLNGTHIETLVLGAPSNPANLIDDPENKTEIKSCLEFHNCTKGRCRGHFKINVEQHKHLLEIGGYYLFCVQDENQGKIIHKKKVPAKNVESKFRFLERTLTKHHYYNLNWREALCLNAR